MPISTVKILFVATGLCIVSCTSEPAKPTVDTREVITKSEHFVMPKLPESVRFCDMNIAIDDFDKEERLDKELIVNTYYHSSTIQYFKRANRYFPMIERILKEEEVPDDFKYLCLIESGLRQAVSPAGAKGFWQFMPATANEYGLRVDREVDERLNIEKSTRAACAYLKDAQNKFEDWALTAASYNRGVGGISGDLERQDVEDYFDLYLNTETSRYVFRILALKLIFEQPEAYGFYHSEYELYEPIKTRKVTVEESIEDLMSWAKENGSNYKMVKLLNPWIKGTKLSYKGKAYIIELPAS